MIQIFHPLSTLSTKPILNRLLMAGAASTVGLLLGIVPTLQPRTLELSFDTSASAQAVSDADVRKYAESVLEIEPVRQQAVQRVQSVLGSGAQLPSVNCYDPNTLNNQPRQVRQIMVDYCTQSNRIVESNSLSVSDFNAITAAQQRDRGLANRIRQEMIRIQRSGGNP